MEVLVLVREGVYRHEIVGVYTDLQLAKRSAYRAIRAEDDRYHSMTVVRTVVDSLVPNADIRTLLNERDCPVWQLHWRYPERCWWETVSGPPSVRRAVPASEVFEPENDAADSDQP